MVNHVERVVPGTVFSKMVMEMDDTAVEKHTLELTLKDILKDPAWITQFVLSFMIVTAASGVLLAGVYVGFGRTMEQSSWLITVIIFAVLDLIIVIVLWIYLAFKVSVENKKRELVIQKRDAGNWRLVDEADWEKFYRLLMIAKNRRESEKIIKTDHLTVKK
jgi:cytochrome b subunit of formate dehydrogenase